jgi:hypothetical protein
VRFRGAVETKDCHCGPKAFYRRQTCFPPFELVIDVC